MNNEKRNYERYRMEIILVFSLIFYSIFIVFLLVDYLDRKRDKKIRNDKYLITDVYEPYSMLIPRKEGENDVEWRERIVKHWEEYNAKHK